MIPTRRALMTGALTLGAMRLFPGVGHAQARRLVFATFTGSWEEAHKDVLVPAFRKATGAEMVLDPMLSVDQIAKVKASLANPPIDVMLHDPGPALVAIGQGLVEPYPVAESRHYAELIPEAQVPTGPAAFFQVVGLTYNPDKVKTPPTSWSDLWKPEYKGRVGITNLNSTLGTGVLVEFARMRGGSEANADAGFQAIKDLKPNIAAVAANPGQLATLYQQGQVDIGPGNFNAIQILKARGVPVEFAVPREGAIAFKTTIHITKNSPNRELAFKLIEAAISPDVQEKLMNGPYLIVPTNAKVKMGGEIAKVLARRHVAVVGRLVDRDLRGLVLLRAEVQADGVTLLRGEPLGVLEDERGQRRVFESEVRVERRLRLRKLRDQRLLAFASRQSGRGQWLVGDAGDGDLGPLHGLERGHSGGQSQLRQAGIGGVRQPHVIRSDDRRGDDLDGSRGGGVVPGGDGERERLLDRFLAAVELVPGVGPERLDDDLAVGVPIGDLGRPRGAFVLRDPHVQRERLALGDLGGGVQDRQVSHLRPRRGRQGAEQSVQRDPRQPGVRRVHAQADSSEPRATSEAFRAGRGSTTARKSIESASRIVWAMVASRRA